MLATGSNTIQYIHQSIVFDLNNLQTTFFCICLLKSALFNCLFIPFCFAFDTNNYLALHTR